MFAAYLTARSRGSALVRESTVAGDSRADGDGSALMGRARKLRNHLSGRATANAHHTRFSVGADDFRHTVQTGNTSEEPLHRFAGTAHEDIVRDLLELQDDHEKLHKDTLHAARQSPYFMDAHARAQALDALAADRRFFKATRKAIAGTSKTYKLVNQGPLQVDMEMKPSVRQPRGNGVALPGYSVGFKLQTGTPGSVVRYTTTRRDGGGHAHHKTSVHIADDTGLVFLPGNNGNIRHTAHNDNVYSVEVLAPNGFSPVASIRLEQGEAPSDGQSKIRVLS